MTEHAEMRHPTSVNAIVLIKLPYYATDDGDLVVMEGMSHFPFSIARVFVVRAPVGAIRGKHAHKACTQFLMCPAGGVEVFCDDGTATGTYILDRPNVGLLIPPGIWAQQTYLIPDTLLTVLCDMPYDPDDYIRSYGDFKTYRANAR